MALDITALNTVLGAYLRENRNIMLSELVLGDDFERRFEIYEGVKDELAMPNLTITDLVKPADASTFSPTGNALAFDAQLLKVRGLKVDLQIVPSDLENTWLGTLRKRGQDPHDLPFEQFIMDRIIAKTRENVYMKAIYNGTYNASGTTPGATMDGFLKLIADAVTASKLTPVVTGAITAANVEEKLLMVYDALDEAYKLGTTQMKVSAQIFDWYIRHQRTTYGSAQDYDGVETMLYGTMCMLVREPALGTSGRVICTPQENMVLGIDSMSDSSNIRTQEFNRTIKVMIDFKAGVIFKELNNKVIAINDQA